jgi:hypothetical protein
MAVRDIAARLQARSNVLVLQLESGLPRLMLLWTVAISFACGLRVSLAAGPAQSSWTSMLSMLPYALVVAAPVASLLLALRWFPSDQIHSQPSTRMARFGQWRSIGAEEARALPLYGATGLMASLLVGMLLNIPIRALEFLAAIPALNGAMPSWFGMLFALMLADVVLLSSLYAIVFVAALRHVPLFPRMLAAVWGLDLLMQILISRAMGSAPDLPVAVGNALHGLLEGNLKKVLISISLWLPYLLLSRRVNLTYRHRIGR